MTRRATQRAPQPIPEPVTLELAPTDYQPSKTELEDEFDMPGMRFTGTPIGASIPIRT